jgi:hypothetical protein
LPGLELHHAARNLVFLDEILGRLVIHAQAGQQGGQVSPARIFSSWTKFWTTCSIAVICGARSGNPVPASFSRQVGRVRRQRRHAGRTKSTYCEKQCRRADNARLARRPSRLNKRELVIYVFGSCNQLKFAA